MRTFLRLLSPYAPHLCEELWQRLGETELIAHAQWPSWDPALCEDETITIVVQIDGKKRDELHVPRDTDREELERLALAAEKARKFIDDFQTTVDEVDDLLSFNKIFVERTAGRYALALTDLQGPLDSSYLVWEPAAFMVAMKTNPREVHHLMRRMTDLIIAFVKERKGKLMAPKSVEFWDSIPLTNLGKVDKKKIREPFWRRRASRV